MSEHNIPLIAMMVTSVGLLFTSMVLSSMASTAAKTGGCDENASKYSTYSAVVSGIAAFLIAIALGFYIYRGEAVGHIKSYLNQY